MKGLKFCREQGNECLVRWPCKDCPDFVARKNQFYVLGFASFMECLGLEWAEQFKRESYYYDYLMGCDCGSSTCDECNPGWDEESFDDEFEPWEVFM